MRFKRVDEQGGINVTPMMNIELNFVIKLKKEENIERFPIVLCKTKYKYCKSKNQVSITFYNYQERFQFV